MIGRSLHVRLAALTTVSVGSVFCLFSAFLYARIRADMLQDLDDMIASKARVLAESQLSRPVIWKEAERLIEQSGGKMAFLCWRDDMRQGYWNAAWPESLDPMEIAPSLGLPEDWRARRISGDAIMFPPKREAASDLGRGEIMPVKDAPVMRRLPGSANPAADPLRRYAAFEAGNVKIIMGADQEPYRNRLAARRKMLLTALAPALLLSFGLGILIARRSLASLNALVRGIESITARGLDRRISPEDSDREFRQLISVVNDMLERLQAAFAESRRFTDAAAHELRSPLTILQGKLDEALRAESLGSERQQTLAVLMEEVARLKGITDRLLLLARSDAGRLELYKESVDLDSLVKNLVEDARLLAPEIEFLYERESCVIECDRALLMQVIHNLLSNAVKYNHAEHGFIRVELAPNDREVELRIANSGPPISPELAERIFDRFFRGDESHSRRVEGTGLGLSLAREIAHAHGGRLALQRSDAKETLFILTLPAK